MSTEQEPTVLQLPVQHAEAEAVDARRRRIGLRTWLDAYNPAPVISSKYGARPMLLVTLLSFITSIQSTAATLLIPEIKHDLGFTFLQLGIFNSIVGLLAFAFFAPAGYIADRVKRLPLVVGGGLAHAIGLALFSFGYSPVVMGVGNVLAGVGAELNGLPMVSLLLDYYAVELRARMAAIGQIGQQMAAVVSPLLVGTLAVTYGWRVPFWIVIGPTAVISLLFLLLKEPVRGYQERRYLGASEEVASHPQPPVSWGEAWRMVWSVRVLRRQCYAGLVQSTASSAFGFLSAFYFADLFHLNAQQRGGLTSLTAIVTLIALIAGAGLIDVFARFRPQRVLMAVGLLNIVGLVGTIVFVLSPNLLLSTAVGMLIGVVTTLMRPATTMVTSLIQPSRARTTSFALVALFALPGVILAQPMAGLLADSFGYRNGLMVLFPLLVVGAIVQLTAIPFFDHDMRNARLSAMAGEAWAESVRLGTAKQLVMRQVDVHYGSVQVLFGVDLDLYQGELLALLGTNGGGKSTLLRAITGLSEASAGAVLFEGDDITHIPPNEIAGRGVIYMRGGQSGFPSLTVRENLRLGMWMRHRKSDEATELATVFAYFPILHERIDQVAGTLSGGEQQMVALAQAFLARPKLLLIDELSLGLAPVVVQQLLGIVRDINARGTTIVLVEQSVTLALELAQRAIFMEKGQVRYEGSAQGLLERTDVLRSVFLRAATASRWTDVGPMAARRQQRLAEAATALEVRDVHKAFGGRRVLDGVDFAVTEGGILGIIGANGAGKTTLFDIITGFTRQDSGRILFAEHDVSDLTPDARARLGLIRRFQDARLFPTLTVLESIEIAFERQLEVRNMLLLGLPLPASKRSERKVRQRADDLIELMSIGAFRDKFISDLSTGSRRIVDLACSIAAGARVLLLDEPSAGVAQRESEEMVPLLQRVRFHIGCTMLVIDHDINLVSSISDELMAMHLGSVLARGEPRAVIEDPRVVSAYLGQPIEAGTPA
ncbi:MAG: MFS transporter [Candidatus Dormibacteria bacterium]